MSKPEISEVQNAYDSDSDFDFLGELTTGSLGEIKKDFNGSPWIVNVNVGGVPVPFKIDTGADVTVISEKDFLKFGNYPLEVPDRNLYGPGKTKLNVEGHFTSTISTQNGSCKQQIYVVKGLQQAFLGRPAIESLRIIQRVDHVSGGFDYQQQFPKLFQGLGKLRGSEYTIKLKPDAQPYSLTTPRRIPLPLLDQVKQELERMESIGVISKIDEPTEWCAGMVVIPKLNGKVRICVDLTKLNENVQREKHQLPAVDQTLGQLANAKVFTKLDANSGFWQIELAKESAKLTTFITPYGRFYFNRLPFGISSAPEHFQKRMSEILDGLDGVLCQADDILVHATTQGEHDARLA